MKQEIVIQSLIPLPLPQQTPAPQTYGDNQQITSVISGGERSNPFEFLDFRVK